MSTYRAVMLTKKGGPETLQQVELPVKEPGPGELRIRVRACGVGYTDVTMRRSYYPYAPKMPFVPGYEVVGEVDALGFELLRQGSIRPRIAARLGLLEGRKAQEMLEAGGIDGKIVLVRGKE